MSQIDRFYALPQDDRLIAYASPSNTGWLNFQALVYLDPEAGFHRSFEIKTWQTGNIIGLRLCREMAYKDRTGERIKVEVDEDNKAAVLVSTLAGIRSINLDLLASLAADDERFQPFQAWKPKLDNLVDVERKRYLAEGRENLEEFDTRKRNSIEQPEKQQADDPEPDLELVVQFRHLYSDNIPPEASADEVLVMGHMCEIFDCSALVEMVTVHGICLLRLGLCLVKIKS